MAYTPIGKLIMKSKLYSKQHDYCMIISSWIHYTLQHVCQFVVILAALWSKQNSYVYSSYAFKQASYMGSQSLQDAWYYYTKSYYMESVSVSVDVAGTRNCCTSWCTRRGSLLAAKLDLVYTCMIWFTMLQWWVPCMHCSTHDQSHVFQSTWESLIILWCINNG